MCTDWEVFTILIKTLLWLHVTHAHTETQNTETCEELIMLA